MSATSEPKNSTGTGTVKLGKREVAMLRDCAKFSANGAGYSIHWAPRTMESLHQKGLVTKTVTGAYGLRWFISERGKQWLQSQPEHGICA